MAVSRQWRGRGAKRAGFDPASRPRAVSSASVGVEAAMKPNRRRKKVATQFTSRSKKYCALMCEVEIICGKSITVTWEDKPV